MTPRKFPRADEVDLYPSDTNPAVLGAIARASEPVKKSSDEEKLHVFWRVFGGAIVSICALVGLSLYNNMQTNIAELRAELSRVNEARGDYVRKDEFNTRITANYERITTVGTQTSTQNATLLSLRTDLDATKERLAKATTEADALKKDIVAIEAIKEKIALLVTDLKAVREESFKMTAELEKNKLADTDRRIRRDEQMKDLEKLIKELHTAVQECQVKLARVEGKQESKPAETKKDTP
jgi:chromosome segregation ATPase